MRAYPIPSYRRHKSTGQAIVVLSGRMFYLGPFGSQVSRNEYDRLVLEWIAAGRAAPIAAETAPPQLTVAELFQKYWRFAKSYYRKDDRPTGEQYPLLQVVKLTVKVFGRLPCEEFGPRRLKAVRQAMIERDWSRLVINRQVQRIVRIFRWGAAEELIPATIFQALQSLPGLRKGQTDTRESKPVGPVEDTVIDQTIPQLPKVVADMVRLQRLTGARPAEVCGLRPMDLDRRADVWVYRPSSHKTAHRGRVREIPIGPQAQVVLTPYLERSAEEFCFSPQDSERARRNLRRQQRITPLTQGNRSGTNRRAKPQRTAGNRYTSESYRRAIARGCDKAFPVPPAISKDADAVATWIKTHRWAPNRLRHTRATEIRGQFGLEAAQAVLGHAHANVTEIYAERNLKAAVDIARQTG